MGQYGGFSSVEFRKPKRSIFDLSHEKRLTTRMGRLVPILVTETLPNDTFRVTPEVLVRFAPILAPLFHRLNVWVHAAFVPTRLLYRDYEAFFGHGRLGTETPPVPPRVSIPTVLGRGLNLLDQGSLADMMQFKPIADGAAAGWAGINMSALPHAACYKFWYDWFRDRNYEADNDILPLASGTLATGASIDEIFMQRYRPWEKDYFTSALPNTQRGDEVLMPMVGSGDVSYLPTSKVYQTDGDPEDAGWPLLAGNSSNPDNNLYAQPEGTVDPTNTVRVENIDEVNLTTSEVSINDFRTAMALQAWYERQNVAGSRYNETVYAHFGRRTSDGRLQRADYLGGGKMLVRINEVVTTSYSEDAEAAIVPPGNPTGHSITVGGLGNFTYNCEEHGFIVMFMSIMPRSGYMEGSHRMFFQRETFLDYPWPLLAHLGEQPVYDYELFDEPANHGSEPSIFGYQSRYADWKYIPSSSHGYFRNTLEYWHLDRKFSATPVLGADFVTMTEAESQDLSDRIFAVGGDVDNLWCYIYLKISVKRSLPYFGTPRLVG